MLTFHQTNTTWDHYPAEGSVLRLCWLIMQFG